MQSKLTYKNVLAVVVAVLLLVQVVTLFALTQPNRGLDQRLKSVEKSSRLLYNELDWVNQQYSLSVLPDGSRLYLPELDITVPLNDTTRSVRYNFNQGLPGDGDGNIRISSSYMTNHDVHAISCSDMVRLKVEPKPDAYSPSQPLYATVALADGRMLQIYASTTKECQTAWQTISPQKIAAEFKNAQSR